MHVEDHGSGEPVMLLHGGLEDSSTWEPLREQLAGSHRVIAADRRGHGRTADIAGAFHYQDFADDIAALVERLDVGPAHLVGFSDGAIIALLLAATRPELARSVVAISANLDAAGLHPTMRERLAAPDPDAAALAPLRAAYARASPDGAEHWPVLHRKVAAMGLRGAGMTTADLETITCPVLVMAGDDDVVRLDHTIAIYRGLRDGQLAIVPGTSHLLLHERPQLAHAMIRHFLAAPTARRLMPMDSA